MQACCDAAQAVERALEESESDALLDQQRVLQDRLAEAEQQLTGFVGFDAEQKQLAGCFVSIGQDGSITYTDNNPESKTYQQRVTAGYLSLATFANEGGLARMFDAPRDGVRGARTADRRTRSHGRR